MLPKHVLIVNQHGDNRGDEAAMLGMFEALADRLGAVRFTVLHQFQDPEESAKDGGHDVRFIALYPGIVQLLRFALGALLCRAHLPWKRLAGAFGRDVVDAYRQADVVVSAPGGPYFGDIYADHEPLHWGYVVLGRMFGRPTMLYATSLGPFDLTYRNAARRFVLRGFTRLVVREEVSVEHLRTLFKGKEIAVEVTTDSALGVEVTPLDRTDWPGVAPSPTATLVAVSVIDYRYPNASDTDAARRAHDDAVLAALQRVDDRLENVHIVFMPQLHGHRRDQPYLEGLAACLPDGISYEVLPDTVESRVQQRIFAASDLVIAGRYHPAVFSVLTATPVACIAYEHKSAGIMAGAGLGEYVIPIEEVTTDRLLTLVDSVIDNADDMHAQMKKARPVLRARARRTAEVTAEAMRADSQSGTAEGESQPPPLTPMAWMRWDSVNDALTETRPRRILELGAGQGAMGWRLASRAEYVGIEPDATSFAVASERLASQRGARMIAGDINDLSADERFDLVCAFEVLEHIEDDTAALIAWRERVDKGGHVLLSVPAHQRRFGASDAAVGHYRRYDRADLDQLLRSAGLEAVWVRGYGAGLGHALETTRNLVLRGSRSRDRDDATARSGRLLQPSPRLGRAVAIGVAPFRALQRPWSQRGQGVGYVVLAARVD